MTQRTSQAAAVKASVCTLALCCAWLAQPAWAWQAAAREQGAATQRQTQKTEGANRAAAVEDETSAAAQAARTAQAETARFEAEQGRRRSQDRSQDRSQEPSSGAPSYGPVLVPRGRQTADPARKDPADVHDETDSLTRPAPAPRADPASSQRQTTNPNLRRPAWQPAAAPMAPRPLRAAGTSPDAIAPAPVPVPAPVAPPRDIVPAPAVIGSCQGNSLPSTPAPASASSATSPSMAFRPKARYNPYLTFT